MGWASSIGEGCDKSGWGLGGDGGRWLSVLVEDGSEFEVDDTEAAVALAVGDVAQEGVVVADAEGFEFGEEGGELFIADALDAGTAVGADEVELGGVLVQHAGDEGALFGLEVLEDADFVGEAFGSIWAAEILMHAAVVADAHEGALGVFGFLHEGMRWGLVGLDLDDSGGGDQVVDAAAVFAEDKKDVDDGVKATDERYASDERVGDAAQEDGADPARVHIALDIDDADAHEAFADGLTVFAEHDEVYDEEGKQDGEGETDQGPIGVDLEGFDGFWVFEDFGNGIKADPQDEWGIADQGGKYIDQGRSEPLAEGSEWGGGSEAGAGEVLAGWG